MDDRGVIGTRRPGSVCGLPLPLLAVGGGPDVVLQARVIAEVIVFRAAEDPHPPLEGHRAGGDPRTPAGLLRHHRPVHAVGRGPDLAARAVAWEPAVEPASHEPHAAVEDDASSAGRCASTGLPSSRASRSSPSGELQTSRGGALKESNHPPSSQSRPLYTTSPLESRGCHPALSVTFTQSSGRSSPRDEMGARRSTPRIAPEHRMSNVPQGAGSRSCVCATHPGPPRESTILGRHA